MRRVGCMGTRAGALAAGIVVYQSCRFDYVRGTPGSYAEGAVGSVRGAENTAWPCAHSIVLYPICHYGWLGRHGWRCAHGAGSTPCVPVNQAWLCWLQPHPCAHCAAPIALGHGAAPGPCSHARMALSSWPCDPSLSPIQITRRRRTTPLH